MSDLRKQHQTIFGAPDGNCYSTSIACVLGIPLEDVPNFCAVKKADWWDRMQSWLAKRGLCLIDLSCGKEGQVPSDLGALANGTMCLLSGPSPRGDFSHSVVGRYVYEGGEHAFKFVHDPHPDGVFFEGPATHVSFFAATEPNKAADNHKQSEKN